MLTGAAIEALRQQGALRWQGPLRGDALLLRLGAPLQPLAAPPGAVDLLDQASIDRLYQPPLPDWTSFLLHPGQLVLCQVADPLRLGPQLGGWIATLSHAARVGLMSHLASPAIMSGWDGHLTLEVHNAGPASQLLRRVHLSGGRRADHHPRRRLGPAADPRLLCRRLLPADAHRPPPGGRRP